MCSSNTMMMLYTKKQTSQSTNQATNVLLQYFQMSVLCTLSPQHGAPSGCRWRNSIQYGR